MVLPKLYFFFVSPNTNGYNERGCGDDCALFLVYQNGFCGDKDTIALLCPVHDRNQIRNLCHSSDFDRAQSWLNWIITEMSHGDLSPELTREDLTQVRVATYESRTV